MNMYLKKIVAVLLVLIGIKLAFIAFQGGRFFLGPTLGSFSYHVLGILCLLGALGLLSIYAGIMLYRSAKMRAHDEKIKSEHQ